MSDARGSMEQRGPKYPLCFRCNLRHPKDCSATPERCYIYIYKKKGIDREIVNTMVKGIIVMER